LVGGLELPAHLSIARSPDANTSSLPINPFSRLRATACCRPRLSKTCALV
jgi:hypothetical protein